MKRFIITLIPIALGMQCFAQQVLGDFTGENQSEWPKVTWYRDIGNNWDEGLIKTSSDISLFGKPGFGVHMSQTKQFGFWSTGWIPLVLIEGGTGNTYIKGNIGIGIVDPNGYKLAVNGKIRAHEIKVEATGWPDYVFVKDYKLPSLRETEAHIKEKGHLPGIPSAAEVKVNGIDLGEMNAKLLQKIEELTLHLIELTKQSKLQNEKYDKEIEYLKSKLK